MGYVIRGRTNHNSLPSLLLTLDGVCSVPLVHVRRRDGGCVVHSKRLATAAITFSTSLEMQMMLGHRKETDDDGQGDGGVGYLVQ